MWPTSQQVALSWRSQSRTERWQVSESTVSYLPCHPCKEETEMPSAQGLSGIHCCPTETAAAARQRPGLAQEGQQQVLDEMCSSSPWPLATVLTAKSHLSYEVLHGLISHTSRTNTMAFSGVFICKNRKQNFAVSEENEVCLTFCSY